VTVRDLDLPDTPAVRLALEVGDRYQPSALRNHSVRSYLFAAARAEQGRMEIDHELLAVASLVHDLGLAPSFDSHTLPFEEAGGDTGWVFAAGAGWPVVRRDRVREIVVLHMRAPVPPDADPESHLLQFSTGLDISGRGVDELPEEVLRDVVRRYPRLDLATRFTACFQDQAARKPDQAAARSLSSGLANRLATNPLDRL
jgi:hypothetical protein